MFNKKECVAALLAGGQGSRLYVLTDKTAKPAVPFGGKYRIIDFPLANCINSGIDTVGVLTQYQPLQLNEYIGNGEPWDLDCAYGGVKVLPPYQGKNGADWYKGTANAIYQNLNFLERYDPEYVLILSGDHIYKMDYSKMLDYHKEKGADCTIGVISVSIEEASRFGIMSADEEGRIFKFEEKPKNPTSTDASMGIYIFSMAKLKKYLVEDAANPDSSNDFGKNIIPAMLAAGEKMYAYPFVGYWKDVGTLDSLWSANMDLLGEKPALELNDPSWRILSRNFAEPPHFVGADAKISNSLINAGCEIYGKVENSVLFGSVIVEKGAVVRDAVIMSDVTVGEGAVVDYAIVDTGVIVGKGAKVGEKLADDVKLTIIGADVKVADGDVVSAGEMLSAAAEGGN